MKLFISVFAFVAVMMITIIAFGGDKKKEEKYDWQPVIGFMLDGAKVFYDANSIITHTTESGDTYNTGTILTKFDKPTPMATDQGQKLGSGLITFMIIECKSRLASPMMDIFFTEISPTKKSKPIAYREYGPVEEEAVVLDKSSAIYHTLCPVYI